MGHIDDVKEALWIIVDGLLDQSQDIFLELEDEENISDDVKEKYIKKYLELYAALKNLEENIHFL
jgi:hypothetical protein